MGTCRKLAFWGQSVRSFGGGESNRWVESRCTGGITDDGMTRRGEQVYSHIREDVGTATAFSSFVSIGRMNTPVMSTVLERVRFSSEPRVHPSEGRYLRSVSRVNCSPHPALNTCLSHFRAEVLRLGDFTERYVISNDAADIGLPTFHLVPQDSHPSLTTPLLDTKKQKSTSHIQLPPTAVIISKQDLSLDAEHRRK